MPKVPCLKKYVTEFDENVFSIDGDILFCKICETKVNSNKRFTVIQHLKTSKHDKLVNRQKNSNLKKQKLFTASASNDNKKSTFSKYLYKVMLCAYIPLYNLTNIEFRLFPKKYTLHDISTESTLNKTYVSH